MVVAQHAREVEVVGLLDVVHQLALFEGQLLERHLARQQVFVQALGARTHFLEAFLALPQVFLGRLVGLTRRCKVLMALIG